MNVKHIALFSVFVLSASLLSSCTDKQFETRPSGLPTTDEFIGSYSKLQESLNAAYRGLADGGAMGGQVQIINELQADDVDYIYVKRNDDYNSIYNHSTNLFLGPTRTVMSGLGNAIGRANYTIQYIDQYAPTQADKDRMNGEARFLRAVAHFEQCRIFAQPWGYTADNSHNGVSIHDSYQIKPSERRSVKDVYAFVESDLKAAATLLPANNGVYADKYAAKGYLAKVYFQQNRYAEAYALADEVITAKGGYASLDSLSGRFNVATSTESVFSFVSNTTTAGNFNAGGAIQGGTKKTSGDPPYSITFNGDLFASYAANDKRAKWLNLDGGTYALQKYATAGTTTPYISVAIVHLTELLLIRAECAAEMNNLATAAADLTALRTRAGLPPVSPSTQAQLITTARLERRLEMVGEGNRLQDLKRIGAATARGVTALPVANLLIRNSPWNCNGMIPQIPDNESQANPNYPSNPTGGCN